MRRSVIVGTGSCLPRRIVSNTELSQTLDTTDEWIVERTGIRNRHIAGEGETTRTLAVGAARAALTAAGLAANDLDLVILATSTPDNTFPATATQVQADLGMDHGAAFDIQAVCSGFIYALTTAHTYLVAGMANRVLVIGAETFSRILDWKDRTTCVLFGDGAGAVILEAQEHPDNTESPGIIVSRLHSDGQYCKKLYVDGGPSTTQTVGLLRMEGREVFKHAVTNIASVMEECISAAGISADDIDWVVPHQANRRILEGTARKLGIASERIVVTLDQHGNTSAASIPLALDHARREGRIKPGQLVLLEAMGGGFTWGGVLLRLPQVLKGEGLAT